jgi:hypothetical protein
MKKNNNILHQDKIVTSSKGGGWKGAFYIILLALLLIYAIYIGLNFPYSFITMEGDDYWVLTWDYWYLKLAMLPAITLWLADFLIQFYGSVWTAVCIQTVALGITGVLAYRVIKASPIGTVWGGKLCWLALLPPVLLGYFCTFSLSFILQTLFLFGMLRIFQLIPDIRGKWLWSLVCVTLGFLLLRTPMIMVLLAVNAALIYRSYNVRKALYWLVPAMLLYIVPIMYSQQLVFIPFKDRYTEWGGYFDPLTKKSNYDREFILKMVSLANEGRWEDLLYKEHIGVEARRGNGTALRYALLAECALGTLPDNLSMYPIMEESQFYFPHEREYVTLQLNRLFYLNLGVYDEAFHQAQEYSLIMPNGNSFSSLRQMIDYSIEEGEWEIAEKFLEVLSKSTCHNDFVRERRQKMAAAKKNFKKDIAMRADNFVGGYPFPVEMLRLARYYKDSPNRKKMLDYAICAYMLRGDVNSFMIAVKAFDIYKDKELPKSFKLFIDNIK